MKALALIGSIASLLLMPGLSRSQESASENLQELECELASMNQRYLEKDPKVQELKKRIEAMRKERVDLQDRLEELLLRYTDKHPQVQELRGRLKNLEVPATANGCGWHVPPGKSSQRAVGP